MKINSLNAKLLAIYLPLVTLTVVISFGILERYHYLSRHAEFQTELDELAKVYKNAFTKAVWEYDTPQIELLLRSIELDPNFESATVYDSFGELLAQTGTEPAIVDPEYERKIDLLIDRDMSTEKAGTLILVFRPNEIDQRLTERIGADALILGILILSLLAVTWLATRRIIVAPISALGQAITKIQDTHVKQRVEWSSNDELGAVVHAFNDMQDKQAEAERELDEYKAGLEALIEQRTAELSENQRLLKGIVDNSSALIYVKNTDGQYLMVNKLWNERLQRSNKQAIGKTDHELFPTDLADKYRENDLRVLNSGRPISEEEPALYPDGEHTLISLKFPILNENGICTATCGISTDISERKQLERELVLAKETAEKANHAKSDFLANMSHEIRTPMNGIIGFTSLALQTPLNEQQQNFLNKIRISADALLALINDILDFSKIEAGKLEIEHTDFELQKVIEDVGDLFADAAANKNLELICHKNPDVPNNLRGDPLRLRQILINLTSNAIKFTEQGEIYVNVELADKDLSQLRLKFRVKDTGVGIKPELIDTVFSSFTQVDGSTSRKFGGTGLGLAICKQLTTLMGGKIAASSQPGQGSTFWCELPFEYDEDNASERNQSIAALQGKRILVVEDNESSREVLVEMLTGVQSKVVQVDSGERALDQILNCADSNEPFHLVLLDWKLPGIDGLETAAVIRSTPNTCDLPIVMITAFGREPERERADQLKLNKFLTKPIQESTLVDTLLEVLGEQKKTTQKQTTKLQPTDATLTGVKILLAEDNPINQEVAATLLTGLGAEVEIANDGREAIDLINGLQFNAVLMDLQMPEIDGYEATSTIRKTHSEKALPIIAMTAHATQDDRNRCLNAGMNDYISKPIDPDKLYSTLRKWVSPLAAGNNSDPATHVNARSNDSLPEQNDAIGWIPGFDTAAGIKRLNGDSSMYAKLLKQFASTYTGMAQEIENTLSTGDLDQCGEILHGIKGVAANLSAVELCLASADLETALNTQNISGNHDSNSIQPVLDHFKSILSKTIDTINKSILLNDPQPPTEQFDSKSIPPDLAKSTADRIRKAISIGDLDAIMGSAQNLPNDSFYAREIVRLTGEFDFDGLEQLADQLSNSGYTI